MADLSAEGVVEEDLYLIAQRWRLPACTWASLYTDSNRLFPTSPKCRGEGSDCEQRQRPALQVLCDDFPELVSGWPCGLLLRYLPVRNIARLSSTSKNWRVLIQDPNVWKLLCALAWPGCKRSQVVEYGGWRDMYMHRPRPRMDGVYLFKWSTQRFGRDEGKGMKDAGKDYYKPVIITLMYKVLLFKTGGRVVSFSTNSESTPAKKLFKTLRRAELRLASKKLKDKALLLQHLGCGVSVGGVVDGTYQLNGSQLELNFVHVAEENLQMYPIQNRVWMGLESRGTGSNDVLTTFQQTTGSLTYTTHLQVPPRPYRFLQFESVERDLHELEGWPQCYIGQALNIKMD